MGIYQTCSAQNDLVLSAWVVSLVCFGFAYLEDQNIANALIFGLLLGLAVFTKATAYIYCSVVVLGTAFFARKKISRKTIFHLALVVFIVLCLNSAFWWRNFRLSGNPLGPTELSKYHSNEKISLYGTSLNVFRNLSANLPLPNALAAKLTSGLQATFHAIKLDMNDPRYTFLDHQYSWPGFDIVLTRAYALHILLKGPSITEDTIGNPLQLLLICLALISLYANRKRMAQKSWQGYVIFWFSMLVLFSGYLRWQYYGNRLLLPWFMLAAPFTSVGIFRPYSFGKKTISPNLILLLTAILLVTCAVPLYYSSSTRPTWQDWNIYNMPRSEIMLRDLDLRHDYNAAEDLLFEQDCHSIGLVGSGNEWEYPFWALTREKWGDAFRIENILVENISNKIPVTDFDPCALLVLRPAEPEEIVYQTVVYQRALDLYTVDVYLPPASPSQVQAFPVSP
jgi:4-amino-4-deoxy-L-arabinose transferase-like glycosyltransferase